MKIFAIRTYPHVSTLRWVSKGQRTLFYWCDRINMQDPHAARPSCFHGSKPPALGLEAYVSRICRHSKCSPVCLVMALVYVKRLNQASLVQAQPLAHSGPVTHLWV